MRVVFAQPLCRKTLTQPRVELLGAIVVECAFVIELGFLNGREKLKPYGVYSVLQYDSE